MNFFDSRNSMGGGNASTEGYGHLDGSSNSSGSRSGGAFDRKQEVSVNVDSNVNWNAGQTWSGQSCNNNKGPNSHESKDYSPKTIIPGIYHDDVIADANSDFNPSGESAFYDQCLHQHQQHQFAIGRDFPYRNARQMNQQQHPLREASHHFVALQTNDSSSFPEPQHLSHQPLQLQQQQQQQQHQDKYHPSRQSMTLREQEHSIDILLAKELNQLSFRERNDINEEIHGVSTLYAVEETPELISRSLEELRFEVAHNVPIYRRRAYERSQQIYQQQQQQWEHPHKNAENNKNNNKNKQHNNSAGYINNPDFLLLFLRRDLFDIRKAASRLANFMELVYELWGEIALTEKTWKSQAYLDPFELKILRSGTLQCLQGRDRAGRRILANFADNYSEKYTVQNRVSFFSSIILSHRDGCNCFVAATPRHTASNNSIKDHNTTKILADAYWQSRSLSKSLFATHLAHSPIHHTHCCRCSCHCFVFPVAPIVVLYYGRTGGRRDAKEGCRWNHHVAQRVHRRFPKKRAMPQANIGLPAAAVERHSFLSAAGK